MLYLHHSGEEHSGLLMQTASGSTCATNPLGLRFWILPQRPTVSTGLRPTSSCPAPHTLLQEIRQWATADVSNFYLRAQASLSQAWVISWLSPGTVSPRQLWARDAVLWSLGQEPALSLASMLLPGLQTWVWAWSWGHLETHQE